MKALLQRGPSAMYCGLDPLAVGPTWEACTVDCGKVRRTAASKRRMMATSGRVASSLSAATMPLRSTGLTVPSEMPSRTPTGNK